MRTPAWLALPLALAACAPRPQSGALAPDTPSTPWITYVCDDGGTFQALYPDTNTARLRLGGQEHALKIAVSGSGARYVGDGLQWWSKGDEGFLAPLKSGETIAAAPGVACHQPGKGPVSPPAPGTPGGLPDDKAPLSEGGAIDPKSGQAAATVVETYYALIESGRTAEAAKLRRDGAQENLKPYASLHAQVGAPGPVEGAAGSLYVEVPVVLYGRLTSGGEYHASGKAMLRRVNDVPGATPEQLTWRIERIEVAGSP